MAQLSGSLAKACFTHAGSNQNLRLRVELVRTVSVLLALAAVAGVVLLGVRASKG